MKAAQYADVSPRFRAVSKGQHGEGVSLDHIRDAESELCVVLPDSYRAFLGEFGWGRFAGWELYGLGVDVPASLHLPSVTLDERRRFLPLTPPHLIPILNNGAGDLYCLDTSRLMEGECPVVCWCHELEEDQIPYVEAPGFLPWLSEELDRAEGEPDCS